LGPHPPPPRLFSEGSLTSLNWEMDFFLQATAVLEGEKVDSGVLWVFFVGSATPSFLAGPQERELFASSHSICFHDRVPIPHETDPRTSTNSPFFPPPI